MQSQEKNTKVQDSNVILASANNKTLGADRTNRLATPENIIICRDQRSKHRTYGKTYMDNYQFIDVTINATK